MKSHHNTDPMYLHKTGPGVFYLDHRLSPGVRAMFAAMSSRLPAGGIAARYNQIVDAMTEFDYAMTESDYQSSRISGWFRRESESNLAGHSLHPVTKEFFDKFVLQYGHSSIMELTGSPAVYTEGISWYTAYLLFDDPLCAGQEFSTRAVRHRDWPMARECYLSGESPEPHPILEGLHDDWFAIFEAEVDWWKEHFKSAENRARHGVKDDEPFRPALDRARWAIPGTIATGCCHTGHLRGRARVLRNGHLIAQRSGDPVVVDVWESFKEGYRQAVPAIADMGLREAIYGESTHIPAHLTPSSEPPGEGVEVTFHQSGSARPHYRRTPGERQYLDPAFNHIGQVDVRFQCSLAVSRDWHRHRTMYPWTLNLVREPAGRVRLGPVRLHPAYEPKSELARHRIGELLHRSSGAYDSFMDDNNQVKAMLALPLGAEVALSGQGGLRDVVYMLELRANAHGANFEYEAQAREALRQLDAQLPPYLRSSIGLSP